LLCREEAAHRDQVDDGGVDGVLVDGDRRLKALAQALVP